MFPNRMQVSSAPVTSGWTYSSVTLTLGGYTSTYYHSDTASAVEVWYSLASLATSELGTEVVPFVYDGNVLVLQSSASFSINIVAAAAATKLGSSGAGAVLSGLTEGLYELTLAGPYVNGATLDPGYAGIGGFKAEWSGGRAASDGSVSMSPVHQRNTTTVRILQTWSDAYRYMDTWESPGAPTFYDVSAGQNHLFRGCIDSVSISKTGESVSYVFLELNFSAVDM